MATTLLTGVDGFESPRVTVGGRSSASLILRKATSFMGRNRRVRHSRRVVPSSRMTEMERALPMTCLLVRM